MIRLNSGMVKALVTSLLESSTQQKMVQFFGSTPPTTEQIATLKDTGFSPKTFHDFVTESNRFGHLLYSSDLQFTMPVKTLQLLTEQRGENYVHTPDGQSSSPEGQFTWFALTVAAGISSNLSTVASVATFIGTVGDVGIGADIEVLTGEKENSRDYTMSDMELTIRT